MRFMEVSSFAVGTTMTMRFMEVRCLLATACHSSRPSKAKLRVAQVAEEIRCPAQQQYPVVVLRVTLLHVQQQRQMLHFEGSGRPGCWRSPAPYALCCTAGVA